MRAHAGAGAQTTPPVIVIVMAYAVHIGDLALTYLQDCPKVWAIGNGLSDWEADAMRARHGDRLIALSRIYEHSEIIDALTGIMATPFWLIDHDCYLLDTAVLRADRPSLENRAGEALFSTTNGANRLTVPETFLLRLNPRVIRAVKRTYGVSAKKYWWATLPAKARDRQIAAGVTEARMPEPGKSYFDTLRVIALLAAADGCGFDISRPYTAACARHPEVIHIGATSWPNWPANDRYNGIGAYFWRRCLDACPMPRARAEYASHWSHVPAADVMRHELEASGVLLHGDSPDLLDFLDALAQGTASKVALARRTG